MYSLHGFDALMSPLLGHVCQRLIVVSYCTPGVAAVPGALGHLVQQFLRVGTRRFLIGHLVADPTRLPAAVLRTAFM